MKDTTNLAELRKAKSELLNKINSLMITFQDEFYVQLTSDYYYIEEAGKSYSKLQMDFKVEM